MKILFVSSECALYQNRRARGCGGSLATVLARDGHDVRVIVPMYTAIEQHFQQEMEHLLHFDVQLGWRRQYCGVNTLKYDGVTYYFLTTSTISAGRTSTGTWR